jgi:hypothetical protein
MAQNSLSSQRPSIASTISMESIDESRRSSVNMDEPQTFHIPNDPNLLMPEALRPRQHSIANTDLGIITYNDDNKSYAWDDPSMDLSRQRYYFAFRNAMILSLVLFIITIALLIVYLVSGELLGLWILSICAFAVGLMYTSWTYYKYDNESRFIPTVYDHATPEILASSQNKQKIRDKIDKLL